MVVKKNHVRSLYYYIFPYKSCRHYIQQAFYHIQELTEKDTLCSNNDALAV
jgi:hypothetical protein